MFSRTSRKRWTDSQDSCLFCCPFLSKAHLTFDYAEGSRLSLSHAHSWVPVYLRTSWVLERTSWRGSSVYCVSDTCNLDGPLTFWIKESNVTRWAFDILDQRIKCDGCFKTLCKACALWQPCFLPLFQPGFLGTICEKNWQGHQLRWVGTDTFGHSRNATVPLWSRLMWVSQHSLWPGMLYSE